jgi:hypothetical protein
MTTARCLRHAVTGGYRDRRPAGRDRLWRPRVSGR